MLKAFSFCSKRNGGFPLSHRTIRFGGIHDTRQASAKFRGACEHVCLCLDWSSGVSTSTRGFAKQPHPASLQPAAPASTHPDRPVSPSHPGSSSSSSAHPHTNHPPEHLTHKNATSGASRLELAAIWGHGPRGLGFLRGLGCWFGWRWRGG